MWTIGDRDFFQTTHWEEVPIRDEEANVIKEGQLRLVNGRTDREVSQIDFAVAQEAPQGFEVESSFYSNGIAEECRLGKEMSLIHLSRQGQMKKKVEFPSPPSVEMIFTRSRRHTFLASISRATWRSTIGENGDRFATMSGILMTPRCFAGNWDFQGQKDIRIRLNLAMACLKFGWTICIAWAMKNPSPIAGIENTNNGFSFLEKQLRIAQATNWLDYDVRRSIKPIFWSFLW